jgi:hypothetical protein
MLFAASIVCLPAAASAGESTRIPAAGEPDCVRELTILENIFDTERMRFANDKCNYFKAAAANRAAMLDQIRRRHDHCRLGLEFVTTLENQREYFGKAQELACH